MRRALDASPSGSGLVLYPDDGSGQAVFRGDVTVRWSASAAPQHRADLLRRYALTSLARVESARQYAVYRAPDPLAGLRAVAALNADPAVITVSPVLTRTRAPRALPGDPLFGSEWNLLNTGQHGGHPGIDLNVLPVWDGTAAGRPLLGSPSEVIAVTDDGLQVAHPDLSPNVVAGRSWNWGTSTTDPTPPSTNAHGTAAAGIAAARGYDGGSPGTTPVGVTGVAPQAGLLGFRVLVSDASDDVAESQALSGLTPGGDDRDILDISSDSWGPKDDRHLEGPGPLAQAALDEGATTGRGGRGIVYVWAAGNGRAEDDNVNYDGYANSRFTIAVGACTSFGKVAPYSEPGAPLMVVAPSGDGQGVTQNEITTTDLLGQAGFSQTDYTDGFDGTSAAAPEVAGVVALMLQANPDLTYRDVQAILMRTARPVDLAGGSWQLNAAGHRVSHDYGYGLVDAAAAVRTALHYASPGPQLTLEATDSPNTTIPDDSKAGVTGAIDMTTIGPRLRLEYVDVDLDAPHSFWHDLEVVLVAPSGTRSVLSLPSSAVDAPDSHGFDHWRFGSALHLDESSQGIWRLVVRDRRKHDIGRFVSWTLHLYGSAAPADTAPPSTRVTSPASSWVNRSVTVRFAAMDEGSNVARTEYRFGARSTGEYRTGSPRLAVHTRSHSADGRHVVWYRSVDNSGNAEAPHDLVINVDTRAPSTRAAAAVRARRGGTARFRYRVDDRGFSSGRAAVRIVITSSGGRTVRVIRLGQKRTGIWQTSAWQCRLSPGAYHYTVTATDSAGNRQARAGSQNLIVR